MNEDRETKFIYMGDPQPNRLNGDGPDYSRWGKLLQLAAEKAYGKETAERWSLPEAAAKREEVSTGGGLLLLGGDLVNRGNRREEWEAFFEAGGDLLDNLKVAVPESFYSFDYGCCHFLVLDSEYMGTRRRDAYKYIGNRIRDDLQESDRQVSIVLMHHPMFTVGASYNDDVLAQTMRDNYLKLFLKYRVDFILCGHQHLYCRTREFNRKDEVTGDEYSLVQLMGVSGTKYFGARRTDHLAVFREFDSVATVFRVTDSAIKLETINDSGAVVDAYTKAVNAKPKKDCSRCPKFEECRGKGNAGSAGALLSMEDLQKLMEPKPENGTVLSIKYAGRSGDGAAINDLTAICTFTLEDLTGLKHEEFEYSVMRKGRLTYEKYRGIRLETLLETVFKTWGETLPDTLRGAMLETPQETLSENLHENPAETSQETITGEAYPGEMPESGKTHENKKTENDAVLLLTNRSGKVKALKLREIITAAKYDREGRVIEELPALITGELQLVFGQTGVGQYNGSHWMREIAEIEILG